jgi:multiple sugar transport system permease protein
MTVEAQPRSRRRPRNRHLAVHIILIVGALAMVFPFVWQVLTTFKSPTEALAVPPSFLPQHFDWSAFGRVLTRIPFVDMFVNSLLSALVRTAAQLVFCSMAGYAFARLRFPFKNVLFVMLLAIMMVPREIYLLPQVEIIKGLGLLNSVPALIAPGLFSAFGTFLMRQFFATLPASLEEAARLDGASRFRVFFSVMLPLARPGLVALAIFTTLWSWNELLWPLIVNSDASKLNLAAGLSTLTGEYITDFPMLMAGSLMAELPMIVLFLVLQRRFIEGIASTGLK